jgi:hypothetical protein
VGLWLRVEELLEDMALSHPFQYRIDVPLTSRLLQVHVLDLVLLGIIGLNQDFGSTVIHDMEYGRFLFLR